MRRKDREMGKAFALSVVDKCEYAVMTVTDVFGQPYAVPLTIAREEDVVYFHSAGAGKKIDCLRAHPQVCMVCVGDTHVPEGKFTTEFESAVLFGTAQEVTQTEEKIHGLWLLCRRHTPGNMEHFDEAIKRSLFRTSVWKIKIEEITGKRKKYDSHGEEMKFGRME